MYGDEKRPKTPTQRENLCPSVCIRALLRIWMQNDESLLLYFPFFTLTAPDGPAESPHQENEGKEHRNSECE